MQFKEYVNTLALIRQEEGEKFLVLKPIFYPAGYRAGVRDDPPPPPPLSHHPHQMPTYHHSIGPPPPQPQYVPPPYGQPQYGLPPPTVDAPVFRAPPPYRPPPEPAPFRRSSLSSSDLSHSPVNVFPPPIPAYYHPPIPPLPQPVSRAPPQQFFRQTSLPSDDFIPASAYLLPQMPERSVSIQDFTLSSHLVQDLTGGTPPAVPPRRLKAQRGDDKENQMVSKH